MAASLLLILGACRKDYLDKKPDKALLVPETLADLQALLDNNAVMNIFPGLGNISADEQMTSDAGFLGIRTAAERNSYLWSADIFEGGSSTDWNRPYEQVLYANIVLGRLAELETSTDDPELWQELKGSALFFRAMAFHNLAGQFALPYTAAGASRDPGIPLRLTADIHARSVRGTLEETYQQILTDLSAAAKLLPLDAPFKSRPSRPAAYALLARVYLSIDQFPEAEQAADSCLAINSRLTDFNSLSAGSSNPFPEPLPHGNEEILFYNYPVSYSFASSSLTSVDSNLYKSYHANDLRRQLFFRSRANGIYTFKGFYGLATDEVFLIRAESRARQGRTADALADLNRLLETRWKSGTFVPLAAANETEALRLIITERRKELWRRGLRWGDLRRLNKEEAFAVTLTRTINGQVYTLLPGDKRYVFPIPDNEIFSSGIEQNPR